MNSNELPAALKLAFLLLFSSGIRIVDVSTPASISYCAGHKHWFMTFLSKVQGCCAHNARTSTQNSFVQVRIIHYKPDKKDKILMIHRSGE